MCAGSHPQSLTLEGVALMRNSPRGERRGCRGVGRWGLRLLGRLPCLHRRIVQMRDQGPARWAGCCWRDAALRVQSDRTLESRTLWAAHLVTSAGRVPNERGSVESDEKTFIDRDERSLHLVGRTCRMNGSSRPLAMDGAAGTPKLLLSARAAGDRCRRSTVLGTTQIRKAFIVIACQDTDSARKTTVDGIGDLLANGLARQDVRDVCLSEAECLAVRANFRHSDDEIAVVLHSRHSTLRPPRPGTRKIRVLFRPQSVM
jgi:hypothetical protein